MYSKQGNVIELLGLWVNFTHCLAMELSVNWYQLRKDYSIILTINTVLNSVSLYFTYVSKDIVLIGHVRLILVSLLVKSHFGSQYYILFVMPKS
ncbi:hypothetical protein KUTeg_012959 [Tegillarca granosa]|uniref:Uncharacterized protein n=1 Tax=Tegillarca granosa TaxID=220873 RepID=A0ABQ9EXH9_TEGGR|nr:hypothetical protein KUTeg_012959 [Tegillarca granosa]